MEEWLDSSWDELPFIEEAVSVSLFATTRTITKENMVTTTIAVTPIIV